MNYLISYLSFRVLAILATLLFYRSYRNSRRRKELKVLSDQHGCQLPPLLENQRPLGVDRLEQIFRANTESRLMELFLFHFRQTGSTLQQIFLGTPAYGTIEPANLEAILSTNFKDWGMGPRRAITFPMFGDGIFTQDGDAWKHSRHILRPQFHHRQYEDLDVFDDAINDLLAAIDTTINEERVIDLQPLFFRFTLDTTTAFLFGESVRSLAAPTSTGEQTFGEAFNTAQEYVAKRFRLLDLYWLIGGRRFKDACDEVHKFADKIIDQNLSQERLPEKRHKYIFLKSLAEQSPDRVALRGQIINILAAGRDTTACLLSWTFFLLVRYPKVYTRLLLEIKNTKPTGFNGKFTRSDLIGLKYLQSILKETLRLYPSVPVNTRSAIRDTILPTGGGADRNAPVLIPKGSAVAYSVYSMHRRPDLYGMDAEIFRPERWEDEDLPLYQNPTNAKWGYLPFNGGPRICLGLDFALTEAAYAVARILQVYPHITLPSSEKVELTGVEKQTMTIVVQIAHGCNVKIHETE